MTNECCSSCDRISWGGCVSCFCCCPPSMAHLAGCLCVLCVLRGLAGLLTALQRLAAPSPHAPRTGPLNVSSTHSLKDANCVSGQPKKRSAPGGGVSPPPPAPSAWVDGSPGGRTTAPTARRRRRNDVLVPQQRDFDLVRTFLTSCRCCRPIGPSRPHRQQPLACRFFPAANAQTTPPPIRWATDQAAKNSSNPDFSSTSFSSTPASSFSVRSSDGGQAGLPCHTRRRLASAHPHHHRRHVHRVAEIRLCHARHHR